MMSHAKIALYSTLVILGEIIHPGPLMALEPIQHDIRVELDLPGSRLIAEDTMTLPSQLIGLESGIEFAIHQGLNVVSKTKGVQLIRLPEQAGDRDGSASPVPVDRYLLKAPAGQNHFFIEYEGTIHHPLNRESEVPVRGITQTPGMIGTQGVFLADSSYWYPKFDGTFVTFNLEVRLRSDWDAVSQGKRIGHRKSEHQKIVQWASDKPQDEILLIAGPFHEYTRLAEGIQSMVFLREPDESLARQYLEATSHYVQLYSELIGPYPYEKFAMVENFWESGFGMPSFTLLGSRVIRLPFILHSSYPHEILHNWWGNSVFLNADSGNWAEGLTTYLADHLIQEQRGRGAEYRRDVLQKYTNYVSTASDFSLREFQSRRNSATEAVGYGKTMMLFHMLRLQMGDDKFIRALRAFYEDFKFKRASFADLQKVFVTLGGTELEPLFAQWIDRTGAPKLNLSQATVSREEEEYLLRVVLGQIQPGPAYLLKVPIAIELEEPGGPIQEMVDMEGKNLEFERRLSQAPVRIRIDPEFDLFRQLDPMEIPPALSGSFGSDHGRILLPTDAPKTVRKDLKKMAETWRQSGSTPLDIQWDTQFEEMPQEGTIWLFGWDNRWVEPLAEQWASFDVSTTKNYVQLGDRRYDRRRHSVVLTARNPKNRNLTIAWVAVDHASAMPGLARKLPHYGKYSYLAFEGIEPTNVEKGTWPVSASPMSHSFRSQVGEMGQRNDLKLAERTALAVLPPPFSEERMMENLRWLADPERRGRGLGTQELDEVAEYLADQFRAAGLNPSGDSPGRYDQSWEDDGPEPGTRVQLRNVVGIIPGQNEQWKGESIVVGAHYDHLGLGWPDVHLGDEGKIHPGADDNASGLSVLLELAHVLGGRLKPERTIVFVAFTGEESGLRGSKHYIRHQQAYPPEKIMGMINLDTVGRLGEKKLLVFGVGSAAEWIHIMRGTSYVTGVPIQPIQKDLGSSDQKAFLDAGIPSVQFFSGPNSDYHRPSDTVDKIDSKGLLKVAAVVKEVLEYLASRPEPLTSTLRTSNGPPRPASSDGSSRKVSLGTVPDFEYEGRGVRLSDVGGDSPAEKAGLRAGDIITRLGDASIEDLRHFSDALKNLEPGDTVSLSFLREGTEHRVEIRAIAR